MPPMNRKQEKQQEHTAGAFSAKKTLAAMTSAFRFYFILHDISVSSHIQQSLVTKSHKHIAFVKYIYTTAYIFVYSVNLLPISRGI